jgi:hypothetical protein
VFPEIYFQRKNKECVKQVAVKNKESIVLFNITSVCQACCNRVVFLQIQFPEEHIAINLIVEKISTSAKKLGHQQKNQKKSANHVRH